MTLKTGAVCFVDDVNPSCTATHPELDIPLLLTKSDGQIRCIENACPHTKHTQLSTGDIEDVHGRHCVVCPRHRDRFMGGLCVDTSTGECWRYDGEKMDFAAARTFTVSVEDGQVLLAPNEASTSMGTSCGTWGLGKIKRKRWLTPTLLQLHLDVPDLVPLSSFWHYCIEYQGVVREYTPAPGSGDGVAVLWIRIYPNGVFSSLIKKARAGQEVRVQIENTLPEEAYPVAVIAGGTGALEVFHDLSLPMLGAFRTDREYDLFQNHGFGMARVTNPLPPLPEVPECCGEGCTPCVLDTYATQCEEYERHQTRRRGRVTAEDVAELPDGAILLCGPPGFLEHVKPLLGRNQTAILLDG